MNDARSHCDRDSESRNEPTENNYRRAVTIKPPSDGVETTRIDVKETTESIYDATAKKSGYPIQDARADRRGSNRRCDYYRWICLTEGHLISHEHDGKIAGQGKWQARLLDAN